MFFSFNNKIKIPMSPGCWDYVKNVSDFVNPALSKCCLSLGDGT